MNIETRSNSKFQLKIEKQQIKELEKELNVSDLGNESYIYFRGDGDSKIKPDIYSDQHHIIGEVYTHLGKLKSAQMHKVASDIFKMVMFNEDSGSKYKMYYVVCDKDAQESMMRNSIIKNAVRLYKLNIICYELSESDKYTLQKTMRNQDITRTPSDG